MNKVLLVTGLLLAYCTLAEPANAQLVGTEVAVYDPDTGNITLNDLDSIGGILARSSDQHFTPGAANALGGFFTESSPTEFDWLFFFPLQGDGNDLGDFFPTGLTQRQLEAGFRIKTPIPGSGDPCPPAIPIVGGIIPEPAALTLAAATLVVLAAPRGNRSSAL